MYRISSILPTILKRRGLNEHAIAGSVLAKVRDWIIRDLPMHAGSLSPVSYSAGVILIHADDSIALAECARKTSQLVEYVCLQEPQAGVMAARVVRSRD